MEKAVIFLCFLLPLICMIPALKAKELYEDLSSNTREANRSSSNFSSVRNISAMSSSSNTTVPWLEGEHEKECKCRSCIELESGEYVIENGTAYVEAYNESYSSSFYELIGSTLRLCKPDFIGKGSNNNKKYSKDLAYITLTGLCISIGCVSLHLIAFVLVPEFRNAPGCCMACLCVSLLSGYISFLVGFDENILSSGGPCIAAAFSTHLFLLSSLIWMNVLAFDVLKSLLNATRKLRTISSKLTFKNFYAYCLYAWGVALGFAIAAVIADHVPNFPDEYRPHFGKDICWFKQVKALLLFFTAPAFVLICMNLIFFCVSAYIITTQRLKSTDPQSRILKRDLIMYSKLAVIMGLSWIFGLLASIIDEIALWYIFVVLNTLQGLFIFLSFTYSPKLKKHFLRMFGFDSTTSSMQISSREKSSERAGKNSNLRTSEMI